MDKYWIMYEDVSDGELTIVSLTTEGEVTAFIEDKINARAYELEDFEVMQGTELSLRVVRMPIKVLLTNES